MTDPAEITARLNAATPGPWEIWRDLDHQGFKTVGDADSYQEILETGLTEESNPVAHVYTDDDAEFISHAPTDIAFLLARVAVLEAQKQAALELHHEVTPFQNGTPECSYSGHVWPCGTFLALGGEETT